VKDDVTLKIVCGVWIALPHEIALSSLGQIRDDEVKCSAVPEHAIEILEDRPCLNGLDVFEEMRAQDVIDGIVGERYRLPTVSSHETHLRRCLFILVERSSIARWQQRLEERIDGKNLEKDTVVNIGKPWKHARRRSDVQPDFSLLVLRVVDLHIPMLRHHEHLAEVLAS